MLVKRQLSRTVPVFVLGLRLIARLEMWTARFLPRTSPVIFHPLTKPPTALCAERTLRFRSEGLIPKYWSCMQTRGFCETTSFVWHTIAFEPVGNSLDLHGTTLLSCQETPKAIEWPAHQRPPHIPLSHFSSTLSQIGALFHILLWFADLQSSC